MLSPDSSAGASRRERAKPAASGGVGIEKFKENGVCSPRRSSGRKVPALVLFRRESGAVGTERNVPSAAPSLLSLQTAQLCSLVTFILFILMFC